MESHSRLAAEQNGMGGACSQAPEKKFSEAMDVAGRRFHFSGTVIGPVEIAADIGESNQMWKCFSTTFVVKNAQDGAEQTGELFVLGYDRSDKDPLVRIHSACLTGDIFGSLRCDCGPQLHLAAKRVIAHGHGFIFYMLSHEGRGIGIHQKLKAYALQQQGYNTYEANRMLGFPDDLRSFEIVPYFLLKIFRKERITLMTNNPKKIASFNGFGIRLNREEIFHIPQEHNVRYLSSKKANGHMLPDFKVPERP